MSQADRHRWDDKYRDRELAGDPAAALVALAEHIPHRGNVLDVAGGSGRNAVWLARRGLDVTLLDVSAVGVDMSQQRAAQLGVSIKTIVSDLDDEPLPAGPWDLIVNLYFLSRPLFAQYSGTLAANGRLIFIHPTRTNLVKHAKPPAPFLLEDAELPVLLEHGLDIVSYTEGWTEDGRHEARLVARKS